MSVAQWEIPMRLWVRYREVRVGGDIVDYREDVVDDVSVLYTGLSLIPTNDQSWSGKSRAISRMMNDLLPHKWDVEERDEPTDGKEVVYVMEVNADEIMILNDLFTKEIKDFVVRGHMTRTMLWVFDAYDEFKKAHPEAFGSDPKDEDAPEKPVEAHTEDKKESEGEDMGESDIGPRAKRLLQNKMEDEDGNDDT